MEMGQVVDFCVEWNRIHNPDEEDGSESKEGTKKKEKVIKRKATQADWDDFFG